jgi:hypothetical protein
MTNSLMNQGTKIGRTPTVRHKNDETAHGLGIAGVGHGPGMAPLLHVADDYPYFLLAEYLAGIRL